jgi:geranylgeranyl diphosphate synthase type I
MHTHPIPAGLSTFQTAIRNALEKSFSLENSPFDDITFWSDDVKTRLKEYALQGKMLRGSLVPLSFSLFRPSVPVPQSCLDAGVVMEILQSFLLVHDDIMDQDELRRGMPSIHYQYQEIAPDRSASDRYGQSMGICTGDVAAFFAVHLLSRLGVDAALKQRLIELVSREILIVGLAQMQDVHHGYLENADPASILEVYTYKTGRYTFSLPMQLGAMIAGAGEEEQKTLTRLGEHLGRIFQIRDDRLGILEDTADTGKSVGGDVTENKQTLYRALLFNRIPPDDPVRTIFGKTGVTGEDMAQIRTALEQHRVIADVDAVVQEEATLARQEIAALGLADPEKATLSDLLEYNLSRRR